MAKNFERFRDLSVDEVADYTHDNAFAKKYCKGDCEDDYNCPHEFLCFIEWLNKEQEER